MASSFPSQPSSSGGLQLGRGQESVDAWQRGDATFQLQLSWTAPDGHVVWQNWTAAGRASCQLTQRGGGGTAWLVVHVKHVDAWQLALDPNGGEWEHAATLAGRLVARLHDGDVLHPQRAAGAPPQDEIWPLPQPRAALGGDARQSRSLLGLEHCALVDDESGLCQACPAGLEGPDCGTCTSDVGCGVLQPGVEGAVCNVSLAYNPATEAKVYACDIAASSVAAFVAPDFTMRCNTTPLAEWAPVEVFAGGPTVDAAAYAAQVGGPSASGGVCEFGLALLLPGASPAERIQCVAYACVFRAGDGRVRCDKAQCGCQLGCPVGTGTLVEGITGPVDINCSGGQCAVQVEGLPVVVTAPCNASECLDPSRDAALTTDDVFTEPAPPNWDLLIAAIPIYILLVLAVVATALALPRMLRVRSALAAVREQVQGQGVADLPWGATQGDMPNVLEFCDVSLFCRPRRTATTPQAAKGAQQPQPPAGSDDAGTAATTDAADGGDGRPQSGEHDDVEASPHGSSSHDRQRHFILRAVSGRAFAGEILAILGPSGSGKSSLLALLGRQQHLQPAGCMCTGTVTLRGRHGAPAAHGQQAADGASGANGPDDSGAVADDQVHLSAALSSRGRPAATEARERPSPWDEGLGGRGGDGSTAGTSDDAAPCSGGNAVDTAASDVQQPVSLGFVQQHDCLLPTLTVAESVLLAVMLRRRVRPEEQATVATLVATLLSELGLADCAPRLVGGSGGIRGVSGGERRRVSIAQELALRPQVLMLDEVTSGLDSHSAQQLVATLRAIVRSHGRIAIMTIHQPPQAVFDMLDRVLLLSGGAVAFWGARDELEPRLAAAGARRPAEQPMADFLLQLLHDPLGMQKLGTLAASAAGESGAAEGDPTRGDFKASGHGLKWAVRRRAPVPPLYRVGVLVSRLLLELRGQWGAVLLGWGLAALFGVFCGCVFLDLDADLDGLINRAGVLFFSVVFMAFFCITSVDSLTRERETMRKEVALGYYPAPLYLAAKLLVDSLLLRLVPALLFGTPVYFMAGLRCCASRFLLYLVMLTVLTVVTQAQAMALVEFTATASTAMLLFVLTAIVYMLFGGLLVQIRTVPAALRWLQFLCPLFFAFETMVVNEFEGSYYNFTVDTVGSVSGVSGELIADEIGFDMDNMRRDIYFTLGWFVLSCAVLLAAPALRKKLRNFFK